MDIQEVFKNYSEDISAVEEEIRRIIPKGHKETYGMLEEYIFRGGKRLRPLLVLLHARMFSHAREEAIRMGAILEAFHNFTLIHDDIEDNSMLRRGKPTLHVMYGIPIALNSGDALYTLIFLHLLDFPNEIARRCVETFKRVVEGQGMELSWIREGRFDIGEEEYFKMVEGKTCALISLALSIFAPEEKRKTMEEIGLLAGKVFQIIDDVLNLEGEEKEYGKEIGGDIAEGKRTLILSYFLSAADEKDRERVLEIYKKDKKTPEEIREVIELFRKYNAIEKAREKAKQLLVEAEKKISTLPRCRETEELLVLVRYFFERRK